MPQQQHIVTLPQDWPQAEPGKSMIHKGLMKACWAPGSNHAAAQAALLLISLADPDEDTTHLGPEPHAVARHYRVPVRTVHRWYTWLTREGWLVIVETDDTIEYRISVPAGLR